LTEEQATQRYCEHMETMLRPRRSRVAAPAVLMSALLGVLIFSTWRLLGDSAFSAADVWEMLGIIAICVLLIGAMAFENKRLRSVELTSESVSGLMSRRNAVPHLMRLERISIPWNSAPKVAVDGVDSHRKERRSHNREHAIIRQPCRGARLPTRMREAG
jgi:hypothetical protein